MQDASLRRHVRELLTWERAHVGFQRAVTGLAVRLRGTRPPGASHSPWEVLEHLRLAQADILAFSRDPAHESPPWPEGYWPVEPAPPSAKAWSASVAAFERDLSAMVALVEERDLLAPLTPDVEATLLREALLLADHNAYHVAELVTLRRLLGAWK